ncbi:MAG: acetyl-CoA carboxylase carboxyl transferase subunit beta, partial [Flavobacteriales bacterium]|nr:acetyl-CoA carboxylase carboxyl transferase subunit beta [Flavobacteriales bacterium]
MGWFKRMKEGITTSTKDKKETPEGLWNKCPECNHVVSTDEHYENMWVCTECNYHDRIGSKEY